MLHVIALLVSLFAPKANACCDCPPCPLCPGEPCCTAAK